MSESVTSSPQPRESPSVIVCVAPALGLAAFFAAGIVAVEAYLAYFTGSHFAWHVTAMVGAFWTAVGVAAGVVVSVISLPVVAMSRERLRRAVAPAAVVAVFFFVECMVNKALYVDADSLGAEFLFNAYFIACWAFLLGAFCGLLIIRAKRAGPWSVTLLFATSALSTSAAAFFVWKTAAAFALVVAPAALVAFGAIVLDSIARPARRAAALCAIGTVYIAALMALGFSRGERPIAPIDSQIGPDPAKAALLAGKPNVVIVVVDTLRADHTSLCGYKYRTTPNLEKLAADCRFFPFGESVDSWTLPAHASLFTSLYPREHGARSVSEKTIEGIEKYPTFSVPLAPSRITLATLLGDKGYNTAAIVSNYTWLCRQFGLDQGFNYYYDLPRHLIFLQNGAPIHRYAMEAIDRGLGKNGKFVQTYWDAGTITDMGQRWIRRNKSAPFFLFLNYMDPHYPYSGVPPFDKIDGDIPYSMDLRMKPYQEIISKYINTGRGLSDEFLRQIINQYDGEIAYTDGQLGRLVETLKAEGLYDDTLLVVTSDHGEFFGEHRLLNHGVGIYEGGVRIPILVKYPNQKFAGEVRRERVSIVDIYPTVLDVLRFPVPAGISGVVLGGAERTIFAEDYENGMNLKRYGKRFRGTRTAVYDGDHKYIRSTEPSVQAELYDLSKDADEVNDLAGSMDEAVLMLETKLKLWHAGTKLFDGTKESARKISPEDLLRLKSVGYIGGN